MSDSSAIDNALMALLSGDHTLMALAPDGVFWNEAPDRATRFVVVSLADSHDEQMLGGRAYEDALYLVKAVFFRSASTGKVQATANSAAARIDVLLEGATLIVSGYTTMALYREGPRVKHTEIDDVDTSIQWVHAGSHYRVQMST